MTTPAELAQHALDRSTTDPAAGELAQRALDAADEAGDAAATAVARRALGLVAMQRGDLRGAIDHLRRAVRVAEEGGFPVLAAEARMSLAPPLAMSGDGKAALVECDRAAASLSGLPRARLDAQWAALLHHQNRDAEALAMFGRALPVLRRHGDRVWEARARHNRGVVHREMGELAKARTDLLVAERLFRETGAQLQLPGAYHHLGMVDAARGDLPAALAWFGQADEVASRLGTVDARGLVDRCAALVPSRLGEEARAAADAAVNELTRTGNEYYLAEALLAQADASLLLNDPEASARSAAAAEQLFVRQRRTQAAALARADAVRARWLAGERSAELVAAARRSAKALARIGSVDIAIDVNVLGAEVALALSRTGAARGFLIDAVALPRPQSSSGRVRRQQAVALSRLLDGDVKGADAALRAGVRVLDRHRATLGATELRARAAGHGHDLAQLGARLAVQTGDVRRAFGWAERWHAGSLQLLGARPFRDPDLASDLSALRQVSLDIEAALTGERDANLGTLRRRQSSLETAINRRVRTRRGDRQSPRPASLSDVAAALGDRVLVELFTDDDDLWSITLSSRGRPALVRLGSHSAMRREIDSARFALRRLATGGRSPAATDAAFASLAAAGTALDELISRPLRSHLGDGPVVIVPTRAAHALPWAVLPSLHVRPISVAPSATAWLRATQLPPRRGRQIVLVAGPRLAHAAREVEDLRGSYRDAIALVGPDATAARVIRALDGATLAHVAAHGTFRADNPLFSALEMADGPLTVHDLEGLRRPPTTLVLPACDSGLSAVHPGDELIGLVASLLGIGTQTIVASLLPVPDDTTREVMIAFHKRLRSGSPPATALAEAQAATIRSGAPRDVAAAMSLVCFGGL